MINKIRWFLFAPLLIGLVFMGCTKGRTSAQVSGKVMYKGVPVTGGTISFSPVDTKETYTFPIDFDGSYTAKDVAQGEVVVIVETESINPNAANRPKANYSQGTNVGGDPNSNIEKMRARGMIPGDAGGNPPKYVPIPPKYADKKTSTLKTTLTSGKQTYNPELSD